MQGIRVAELKSLLEYLETLKIKMSVISPSEAELTAILEKEKSLKKIYSNYRESLQQVSACVQLFENEKLVVRKFLKQHKQSLKAEKSLVSK